MGRGRDQVRQPEIREAFAIYQDLLMTDGNVYGGAKGAASNSFARL